MIIYDTPPYIRDAVQEAEDTPVSNAILSLLAYVETLERRIEALEWRQQPTNAVSPYDLSAQVRIERPGNPR